MKSNNGLAEVFSLLRTGNWQALFYGATTNGWIQLFRYGFVGGGAFIVDFGTYCLLEWKGFHYLTAGVLSFVVGFAFNFLVSRWLIFCATASAKIEVRELVSVLVISLIGLLLTEGLLFVGRDLLQFDSRVSKIVASIIALFWNYVARKIFVYNK